MINQAVLMGRLTKDVELRYLQSNDNCVARFILAVDKDYKVEGKPEANFITCTAWNKTAEFVAKHFRKGNMVAVIGSIETDSYTDRDGKKVYTTEVRVSKASFTGERAEGSSQPAPSNGDGFMSVPDGIDEELPFN